jgi:hypothetical protein
METFDMDILGKAIWQQAAGDTDRNYADVCLKWDVILNGPGYAGSWPECIESLRQDKWSARKITDLKRFSEEMADGDLVVLRIGTATVLAVGQVVGGYEWSDKLGDVDGWDLQHVRRVRWLWYGIETPQLFDTYALKQGDTTQRLTQGPVTEWLAALELPEEVFIRPLAVLPLTPKQNELSVSEVSEFLFDYGVASDSITNLLAQIGELTRIAKWYQRSSKPSEHETVAYLVVPLLRALGWTPQRMAVEWNYVDIALFDQLPRSETSLRVVVEAKKMDNSCISAMFQALTYATGKANCHRLIVTDGLRYGVYVRRELEVFSLYAYLNLTRLRHAYRIYGCKGAQDALLAMAPEWKPSEVA